MKEHKEMVTRLAKPGADILAALTPEKVHLWHMATGVSGEAGELLDAVKKHVAHNKELDRDNVVEELGDLEFYMEGLRQGLGITREETLLANIGKLAGKRYALGYSDAAAVARADKAPVDEFEELLEIGDAWAMLEFLGFIPTTGDNGDTLKVRTDEWIITVRPLRGMARAVNAPTGWLEESNDVGSMTRWWRVLRKFLAVYNDE